jgi:GGDEF domain-containing protein
LVAVPGNTKNLFGRPSGEAAKPVQAAPGAVPAEVASSLKTRLAAAVQGRDVIAAGSFHLVGLAEIRERLGKDWERVRDKVHRQTQRIIERHIAPRDVYFPGGPDDYVLVFAEMGKAAAQLICAKITQEVQRTLLGDSETVEIGVRTLVSETDGSLRIEKAKLSDLVASAAVAAQAVDPVAPPAGATAASQSRSPAWETMQATRAAPRQAAASALAVYGEIVYRPIWDVQREALTTYLSRRAPPVTKTQPPPPSPEQLAQLDSEALRSGIEVLADLYQNKFRLRLSFPVSFEAISAVPRFRSYLELCRAIPEDLRKLVAFELVDLPTGVPNGRLAELAAALRPYCGLVTATVDWVRTDLSQYANTGIRMVNAVILPGTEEKRTLADMDRFARAAEKAGLLTAVEGVTTSSVALAAKGAGIGFISGDRIGPCIEVPEHMLRFTWSELYFGKPRVA